MIEFFFLELFNEVFYSKFKELKKFMLDQTTYCDLFYLFWRTFLFNTDISDIDIDTILTKLETNIHSPQVQPFSLSQIGNSRRERSSWRLNRKVQKSIWLSWDSNRRPPGCRESGLSLRPRRPHSRNIFYLLPFRTNGLVPGWCSLKCSKMSELFSNMTSQCWHFVESSEHFRLVATCVSSKINRSDDEV